MNIRYIIPAFCLIMGLFGCGEEPAESAHLGEISFAVSGNDAAKPLFEKGLLLLHSFEYDDAKEAFVEAQAADPSFAMAYWGEALTYNHNLWSQQDYEKGRDALDRLEFSGGCAGDQPTGKRLHCHG